MAHQENESIAYMQGKQPNMVTYSPSTARSLTEETRRQRALYPEIHYKLEPFISNTCDIIESSGVMPSQQELDEITDNIYDEFCQMYPDMENYMKANDSDNDMPEAIPAQFAYGGRYRPGRGRFRRRGIGRDLISALLLARLFGGRRPYYPSYPNYHYY